MELEEADIFDITDYTTASDWERFVGSITDVFHQWKKLSFLSASTEPIHVESETCVKLDFAGSAFYMKLYSVDESESDTDWGDSDVTTHLLSQDYDFTQSRYSKVNWLPEWFGVKHFVLIEPVQSIDGESRVRVLLSSLHMALLEAEFSLPVFAQLHKRGVYQGAVVTEGIFFDFQTILLSSAPEKVCCLSGLLEMFKQKLATTVAPIVVSVRFRYRIDRSGFSLYPSTTVDPADLDVVFPDTRLLNRLPIDFQSDEDFISGMELIATWQQMSENLLLEDEFTQLDPLCANRWSLKAEFNAASGLLGAFLTSTVRFCDRGPSDFILAVGRAFNDSVGSAPCHAAAALSQLTDAVYTGKWLDQALSGLTSELLPTDVASGYVDVVCCLIFTESKDGEISQRLSEKLQSQFSSIRSAERGSLLWRLAIVLCHLVRSGSASLVCRVWERFVQLLRAHWEVGSPLKHVLPGNPDFNTSILHQKLQMLNCCIRKRNASLPPSTCPKDDDADGDDDEFFDAVDKSPSAREAAPEGRASPCGTLKLLNTGEQMYIPVTQEMVPMTVDRLEEHSKSLLDLGSDAEGAHLRAKLLSISLISDMSAFQAANPGCILVDFVRWYSPRDWVTGEETDEETGSDKGTLSARMRFPGNLWQQAWQDSVPVPARRQKRLFDEVREAEMIFQYLTHLKPREVVQQLAPVMFHAAIWRVVEESQSGLLATVEHQLHKASKLLCTAASQSWSTKNYEEILAVLGACEMQLLRSRSLMLNLGGGQDSQTLIQGLINGGEMDLPSNSAEPLMSAIRSRFTNADEVEPKFVRPVSREYILRSSGAHASAYGGQTPQRLHCHITENSYRVSTSLSRHPALF